MEDLILSTNNAPKINEKSRLIPIREKKNREEVDFTSSKFFMTHHEPLKCILQMNAVDIVP